MLEALQNNTLLLILVVIALGYSIGTIQLRGISLGVAAVLCVGLLFGGLSPELKVPEIIILLGLSIFVYTIGLMSGPGFFRTLSQGSAKHLQFIILLMMVTSLAAIGVHYIFDIDAVQTAAIYSGGNTNTPALAALLDAISISESSDQVARMQNLAVVGYSLSYPIGVLGVMIAMLIGIHVLKVDFRAEERSLKSEYPVRQHIKNQLILVNNPTVIGREIRDIKQTINTRVVFGRLIRDGKLILTNYDTRLEQGDKILIAADEDDLDYIVAQIGSALDETVSDTREYSERRIFVSNPAIAGRPLSSLDISRTFSAIVSRITRGDVDILASGNTVVELGDRVRVIGRNRDIPAIKELFGDSYEALSHINLLSFGLGLALGLLLGMVTIELPGGIPFNLGYAGGPLIVAVILGSLRRTGPIVWSLPYSANLTLQQIGLSLMLAGIGVNSGHAFWQTIITTQGLIIVGASILMVCSAAFITLLLGYKLLKIPMSLLLGMMSNQPAILEFVQRRTDNKIPSIGYTTLLPILLIAKILAVQLLYALL